ncbi:hypothetical protein TNCV_5044631 [Trichonephila clavipes]|uniref:Uncharacterized protein n=1 Tax=Trichonephila clavipes TaxID=2585209 RepID=A0A8X7BL17_TRICX|nr:hypothetical protein TNCV_5044631 [Trichonephila clavipes]
MFDGLVACAVDRWRHDSGARRVWFFCTARVTNEGRKVRSGCLGSERKRVLYRSRQNDRLHVMLVQVHIDITPPHASYWRGPNNRSLWSFLNAPVPDDPSEHLDSLSQTSPFLLLKKPVNVLQGVSPLSRTGPVNGYTTGLCLAFYDYTPANIEDQNPNNGQ